MVPSLFLVSCELSVSVKENSDEKKNFCQVDLLDQQPCFKISSIRAPLEFASEVDADLVE